MLVFDHQTDLALPSAPEFGSDGIWPPADTEWLQLRWTFFTADSLDFDAHVAYRTWKNYTDRQHDLPLTPSTLIDGSIFRSAFSNVSFSITEPKKGSSESIL